MTFVEKIMNKRLIMKSLHYFCSVYFLIGGFLNLLVGVTLFGFAVSYGRLTTVLPIPVIIIALNMNVMLFIVAYIKKNRVLLMMCTLFTAEHFVISTALAIWVANFIYPMPIFTENAKKYVVGIIVKFSVDSAVSFVGCALAGYHAYSIHKNRVELSDEHQLDIKEQI